MALIDSGATYNFISQAIANRLGLEPARSGRRKRNTKKPPLIATVNGAPLCTTSIVRKVVRMRDSAGTKRSHAINFVVADIAGYNMILGMAWLQKQNPAIHREIGK
jgi:predicted aspartyl protease